MKTITAMRIITLLAHLQAPAMEPQKESCLAGFHTANDLLEYVEIIPHEYCTHSDRCGYCCPDAKKREVTQCWYCNHRTYSHSQLGAPKEFFRKQTELEKDLINASKVGILSRIDEILKANVNPDTRDFYWKNGRTALMYAAESGHLPVVQRLLNAHANPDILSLDGETALTLATSAPGWLNPNANVYDEIVKTLLQKKANPELHAFDCNTPLVNALYLGKNGHEMVQMLLDEGANPRHKSCAAPIDYADDKMKVLLQQYMEE